MPLPMRGFRLYRLELFRGGKRAERERQPFGREGWHYGDYLTKVTEDRLLGQKFNESPRLDYFLTRGAGQDPGGDDDEDSPESVFEVQNVRVVGRRIMIQYRAGGVGAYAAGVSPRAGLPDVDLRELAAVNEQRAWVLLPDDGLFGVMVAESAGRASGELLLLRWVHAASKAEENGAAHWRVRAVPVTDPLHLQELIDEEALREVVLTRVEETGERSNPHERIVVRSPLKTGPVRRGVTDLLRSWLSSREHPATAAEGAGQLAAILDENLADMNFDDGYVKVKGDETSSQRLRPDLAHDIFTYSLGRGYRTEAGVLRQAREVAERLQELSELALPWVDALEGEG